MEISKRSVAGLGSAVLVIGIVIGIALAVNLKLGPENVRVEEKIKVVEVAKEVVVVKEVVRVEVVRVKDTQVVDRWRREKTEVQDPDGTVTKKEVEERNIDTVVKEKETKAEVKIVEVIKEVVVEREKIVERTVEPVLPKWHAGVLAGVAPRFDQPLATPVMVGLEVERRLAGPVWLGGWAMGGSPVVGGFALTNVAIGLKVGMEFP
jgi:hypothetical protein